MSESKDMAVKKELKQIRDKVAKNTRELIRKSIEQQIAKKHGILHRLELR